MNKEKIKHAFANGLAVVDGNKTTNNLHTVVDEAFWQDDSLDELFNMVLNKKGAGNIALYLQEIVDSALDRVSTEIIESFEE